MLDICWRNLAEMEILSQRSKVLGSYIQWYVI